MVHKKVLVIGIDGATFDIINPLIDGGKLPNLKKLIRSGASGILKSTFPPMSPPAWVSFMTGKNPGSHSIFGFREYDARSYNCYGVNMINSSFFSGKTIFDILSSKGLKVGVFKVPLTYPPWKVNGVMVSGFPSPDLRKAFTYPPELGEKLGKMALVSIENFNKMGPDGKLKEIKFDLDKRLANVEDLITSSTYDFFMFVLNTTDAIQHFFWKYMVSGLNGDRSYEVDRFKNVIFDMYEQVDAGIGKILEKVENDTLVVVMSDHGGMACSTKYFHVNAWLKSKGFLSTKNDLTGKLTGRLSFVINILASKGITWIPTFRKIMPEKIQKNASDIAHGLRSIDTRHTLAYSTPLYANTCGIEINLEGRQSDGIVKSGAEYEKLRDDIINELKVIRTEEGNRIVEEIYKKEEIYSGPEIERAPDIVFIFKSEYEAGNAIESQLITPVDKKSIDIWNGYHSMDGVLIFRGEKIKKGMKIEHSELIDILPTIMYALNLSVPTDVDGRVLKEIFEDDFKFKTDDKTDDVVLGKLTYSKTKKKKIILSKDEEDKIKKRLEGLGYL